MREQDIFFTTVLLIFSPVLSYDASSGQQPRIAFYSSSFRENGNKAQDVPFNKTYFDYDSKDWTILTNTGNIMNQVMTSTNNDVPKEVTAVTFVRSNARVHIRFEVLLGKAAMVDGLLHFYVSMKSEATKQFLAKGLLPGVWKRFSIIVETTDKPVELSFIGYIENEGIKISLRNFLVENLESEKKSTESRASNVFMLSSKKPHDSSAKNLSNESKNSSKIEDFYLSKDDFGKLNEFQNDAPNFEIYVNNSTEDSRIHSKEIFNYKNSPEVQNFDGTQNVFDKFHESQSSNQDSGHHSDDDSKIHSKEILEYDNKTKNLLGPKNKFENINELIKVDPDLKRKTKKESQNSNFSILNANGNLSKLEEPNQKNSTNGTIRKNKIMYYKNTIIILSIVSAIVLIGIVICHSLRKEKNIEEEILIFSKREQNRKVSTYPINRRSIFEEPPLKK